MRKLVFIAIPFSILWGIGMQIFGQAKLPSHKRPLPVIDMHLHALAANGFGPAPQEMGIPYENWGDSDPKNNFGSSKSTIRRDGNYAKNVSLSPLTDDLLRTRTLKALEENNVYAVTSGSVDMVRKWHAEAPKRIINAVWWDFADAEKSNLKVDGLTKLFRSGEFQVLGEVGIQYEGISPSSPAFEPYLKMAQDLDIPVGIHVGPGPPGAPYRGSPNYRASMHTAFLLEDALVQHPKLRVYAMHAGWPMLDNMLAAMYAHPQLYVELGLLTYFIPEKEFNYYLGRLVGAGFGKRIMFGSDNMLWPETIKFAIGRINRAKFLTAEQKRDILFENATRFLRLSPEQIKSMH